MMNTSRAKIVKTACSALLLVTNLAAPAGGFGYVVNLVVADLRQPSALAGNTACPQMIRQPAGAGAIRRQWSVSLGVNPVTILTADQTATGRLDEIESAVAQAFAAWTGVSATALTSASSSVLARVPDQTACAADGVNTICFNQPDAAFTTGVLAFTRQVTSDAIGERAGSGPPATFVGQILDADILVRPADVNARFATPAALGSNPAAYDLASILTHETGHMLGLGHSGVWRSIMFPFVPAAGTFAGQRPTALSPDAPLSTDDRTAARVLYPDASDNIYVGSISGHVLPANPITLAAEPAGVTGIFGAQVVAMDASTGAVVASAVSGWSCTDPGPPVFDGSYRIAHLPVNTNQTYQIYAEPLDGPVDSSDALEMIRVCRNAVTDAGWPAQFACITPSAITNFSTKIRSGP